MNIAIRLLLLVVVVPAVYYFVYWVPCSLVQLNERHWMADIASLFCAAAVGWFVWSGTGLAFTAQGLGSSILLGALITGGVGFAVGFFGPIIITPSANQGPLLGIFITGPIGLVLGGVGGLIYWQVRSRKSTVE